MALEVPALLPKILSVQGGGCWWIHLLLQEQGYAVAFCGAVVLLQTFLPCFSAPLPAPEALSPPLRSSIVHLSLYLASSEHTRLFLAFCQC